MAPSTTKKTPQVKPEGSTDKQDNIPLPDAATEAQKSAAGTKTDHPQDNSQKDDNMGDADVKSPGKGRESPDPDEPMNSTEDNQTSNNDGNKNDDDNMGESLFHNSEELASDQHDSATEDDPDSSEWGPPILDLPAPQTTSGDDTVGWIHSGLQKQFINRYGSKQNGMYFVENDCVDGYTKPDDQNVTSENIRKGYLLVTPGRSERVFTRRHVDRIMAVAWECKVPGPKGKTIKYDDPLDYIDPSKKFGRYPRTYLYVRWKKDGRLYYAWETRSEMSVRYKSETDAIVFQAACEQAARNHEVAHGRRRASKSPSTGLADNKVREGREDSLRAQDQRGSPSRGSPVRLSKDELRTMMEEFQMMYLVSNDVNDIEELDSTSTTKMFNSWREYRAQMVTT